MGRDILYAHEIRNMTAADRVVTAYQQRKNSKNWAEWSEKNPAMVNLLLYAEMISEDK